ncbi:Ribosomal RNA small subunit methyltransferase H [bioreactor metagenome]|uniref:Ribosomal RNA small subunit methyltransferase H n=1 Tax=bioreactor metagenome TaxID=1076179 RepID=A0A645CKM3_9ZZZZ
MRMDTTQGETAAAFLARAEIKEITEVIRNYGEERFAFQIAKKIVAARGERPVATTGQLAALVREAVRTREPGQDPATRTFQALRIHINQELEQLALVLPQAAHLLKPGGRLVVISFHSLEDRVTKGATLMDLIKIEQVKDLKLRNGILEALGTSNFEWKLNRAIHEEKRKSNLPKWIELMETFAEKITEEMARGGRPWRYRRMDDLINDPATYTLPEDRDRKRYGYTTNGGYVNLYWHDESSESAERKEPEFTERQQRILEAQNSLVESSSMAYRLRIEFIKKVSLPSKKINEAVAYLIQLITHKDARFNYSYPNDRTVDALFDIESGLGWQATADARSKALLEVSTLGLQQALPKMICCIVGDEPYARYINTYGSNKYTDYKANPALDAYYSFLEEIGYQISDEERLLMSGKHPLLQLAKDDPALEDAEDEEEDVNYDEEDDGEEDEE